MSSIFPQRPTTHYRRISSSNHSKSPTRSSRKLEPPPQYDNLPPVQSPLHPPYSPSSVTHRSPSIAPHTPHIDRPPPLRSSTMPLPSPLPTSPLARPPIVPRSNSMMYNPYQWANGAGAGGNAMNQGGYNPYMMMGGNQAGSMAGGSGAMSVQGESAAGASESGLKPFDSAKMKQGRMGHYGYLEGRELAGPPPGYMPAGVQANQYNSPGPANQISPSHRASSNAGGSYYPTPPSQAGSVASGNGSMAWGDMGNTPRARYDGSSSVAGYVQADLDTPYPRVGNSGASSAFTRYAPDGSIRNGIDGRMGINHRRLREGRV